MLSWDLLDVIGDHAYQLCYRKSDFYLHRVLSILREVHSIFGRKEPCFEDATIICHWATLEGCLEAVQFYHQHSLVMKLIPVLLAAQERNYVHIAEYLVTNGNMKSLSQDNIKSMLRVLLACEKCHPFTIVWFLQSMPLREIYNTNEDQQYLVTFLLKLSDSCNRPDVLRLWLNEKPNDAVWDTLHANCSVRLIKSVIDLFPTHHFDFFKYCIKSENYDLSKWFLENVKLSWDANCLNLVLRWIFYSNMCELLDYLPPLDTSDINPEQWIFLLNQVFDVTRYRKNGVVLVYLGWIFPRFLPPLQRCAVVACVSWGREVLEFYFTQYPSQDIQRLVIAQLQDYLSKKLGSTTDVKLLSLFHTTTPALFEERIFLSRFLDRIAQFSNKVALKWVLSTCNIHMLREKCKDINGVSLYETAFRRSDWNNIQRFHTIVPIQMSERYQPGIMLEWFLLMVKKQHTEFITWLTSLHHFTPDEWEEALDVASRDTADHLQLLLQLSSPCKRIKINKLPN